jgi:magnesium chelatase accessory protein
LNALSWDAERGRWPNARDSQFVEAGGVRWHVQRMGQGPVALLLHGTGASTHSWARLAPQLAEHFSLIIPDLPGHAFSSPLPRGRLSLPGMANAVAALLDELELAPSLVIGHSAGAAILARCCIDRSLCPDLMVSINGALLPFAGPAGLLFPPMAKLLFANPLAARILATRGRDEERVRRLINGTGSAIDAQGISLYARLFRSPSHVAATLGMMANWNLRGLRRDLSKLRQSVLLVVGNDDRAVRPQEAEQLEQLLADARVERLPGLGHLAHEEDPQRVGAAILAFADRLLADGGSERQGQRAVADA